MVEATGSRSQIDKSYLRMVSANSQVTDYSTLLQSTFA